MESSSFRLGIIILAAGASSRMGRPKQLLKIEGETLINRMIHVALSTDFEDIIVVLGANKDKIEPIISESSISIVVNENWALGMGSSIRIGMESILKIAPDLDGVMFLLVDQPHVDLKLLLKMINLFQSPEVDLIATAYNHTFGVPALFGKIYFAELLALNGQEGARKIIFKYKAQIKTVPFPQGSEDLDTPDDWVHFLKKGSFK